MTTPASDDAAFDLGGHVVGRIGVHATDETDPCGPGMHLHLDPVLVEPDGHVDFGALGVFVDVASSQAVGFGPFVHADISLNRVGRPRTDLLHADVSALRIGKRSSIVHLAVRDSAGTAIADSTQQIVAVSEPSGPHTDHHPASSDERRQRFRAALDGVCRLPGRLHEVVGIGRAEDVDGSPSWSMPSTPLTRNGFGGLHGGIAFDLVTHAAAEAGGDVLGRGVEPHGALLRYLAPATGGPFRAVATVLPQDGDALFVRVAVSDDGQDGKLCIVGEVHATHAG